MLKTRRQNAISIRFQLEKNSIKFTCENSYTLSPQVKPEHSGLGNELIERRLALLYPAKHSFTVDTNNGIYKVNLLLSV
jgi:two-component system LytT family sensor kinase